jgi:UDP-N-acetyl-D-glucosamine dehydrogenase
MLRGYDVVLLATDHDKFDYESILTNSKLIVDTRGRFLKPAANVVKA